MRKACSLVGNSDGLADCLGLLFWFFFGRVESSLLRSIGFSLVLEAAESTSAIVFCVGKAVKPEEGLGAGVGTPGESEGCRRIDSVDWDNRLSKFALTGRTVGWLVSFGTVLDLGGRINVTLTAEGLTSCTVEFLGGIPLISDV